MEYKEQVEKTNILHLRELCKNLPAYAGDYFRGIEPRTASRTRIAYAYDLNIFFKYLTSEHPDFKDRETTDITLSELEELSVTDLERFLEYVKYYKSTEDMEHMNGELAIKRKVASLKSFYNYFIRTERIQKNPAALLQTPRLHDKNIIRLDPGEVADLLDQVESGDKLTDKQRAFHDKTAVRDLALITLLLGTGIRVSECVGLNLQDYDEREGCIRVFRKGGKESTVYFGDEVMGAMEPYLDQRQHMTPAKGHEDALFLSLQMKRINVRSVENLVKKYTQLVTNYKKITPHKLRSTYGTNLYQATGDIYLVADVLGHNDVNTTKKHYAAIDEDQRKLARNKVKLRDTED
jgi:site-specific recombinase XerD